MQTTEIELADARLPAPTTTAPAPALAAEPASSEKPYEITIKGRLTKEEVTKLKALPGGLPTYIIAPQVTQVESYAFYNCRKLISASFPIATRIGTGCFANCVSLTTIEVALVTNIGANCFRSNHKLASIYLPAAEHTGPNAFRDCEALTTISLPKCSYVGDRTFMNCKALVSVSLPVARYVGHGALRKMGAKVILLPPTVNLHTQSIVPLAFMCAGQMEYTCPCGHPEIVRGDREALLDTPPPAGSSLAKAFGEAVAADQTWALKMAAPSQQNIERESRGSVSLVGRSLSVEDSDHHAPDFGHGH